MSRKLIIFLCITAIMSCVFNFEAIAQASPNAISADMVTDDDSVFVDGINQSYLNYLQISKEELLSDLANRNYNDDDALLKSSSQSSGSGFFDFADIIKNPGTYFKITPVLTSNPYLEIGLNYEKLNETLKYINYPIKETRYNRFYIRNIKLKKVNTKSLYFSSEIQVKMYTKKPWPLSGIWKIVDKTGKCDIRVDYSINSSDNSITFKKINAKNIRIDNSIWSYIIFPVTLVTDFIVGNINHSVSIDETIKLSFLPPEYLQFSKMYTEGYFLYMNFNIPFIDKLPDLLKNARDLGVEVTDTQKDAIPVMKSNTSPSGKASASSIYSSSYSPWKAFDGNDESGNCSRWISKPRKLPAWLSYEFPSSKKITKYFILPELAPSTRDRAPKNWTFEGWNGKSWVILDTRKNITLQNTWITNIKGMNFDVKKPGYYKKYRINITALNGSDAVSIRQLKMFETTSSSISNLTPIVLPKRIISPEIKDPTKVLPHDQLQRYLPRMMY